MTFYTVSTVYFLTAPPAILPLISTVRISINERCKCSFHGECMLAQLLKSVSKQYLPAIIWFVCVGSQ